MKKILSIIFVAILATTGSFAHSDEKTQLKKLGDFARNMTVYNNMYTQEKVYLHLDNSGYLPGETMWFKAYVFNASSLLPTDLSKVLYVELLSPVGQVMERRILPVNNGRTYGEFKLDPILCRPGYYEVRAYTRAMLNWDNSYIFSRVLPVFEAPEDTVNFSGLSIGDTEYYYKPNGLVRSTPAPLVDKDTQKKHNIMLTFYPEGGNITKGIASSVAFKLTDKDGLPLDESITIYDNVDESIADAKTFHNGMGVFTLPDNWTGGYAVVNNHDGRFPLPQQRNEGCDIHIEHNADNGLGIYLHATEDVKDSLYGVSVTCRGRLCYFSDITPAKKDSISIPYERLRDGVHQVTLFTPDGEILSERLVWVKPHKTSPTMVIRQNEDTYKPFSPIVLDIDLKDAEGNPLRGDFSLSVKDAATVTGPEDHSLSTEMLLASELKGYIHNPEYYFKADDEKHRQALDLLLMVQGWRRYAWKEMAGVEPFELKQPAEDGLLFFGNITDTKASKKKLSKDGQLSLNLVAMTPKGPFTYTTETDKKGNFALKFPDFSFDLPAIITITDKADKRVYADLKINRNFAPQLKPYEPLALSTPVNLEHSRISAMAKPSKTFEWTDTIPDLISKVINLKTVNIKQKRVNYGYSPKLQYISKKGEENIKQSAVYYYNLKEELDKYLDEGNGVPNVWEWLSSVNANFEYFPGTEELSYHGRPALYISDLDKTQEGRLGFGRLDTHHYKNINISGFLMHEYRSLIIAEDPEDVRQLMFSITGEYAGDYHRYGGVLFLFSRDNDDLAPYYKRGTRWITIHGYSRCEEFYSPDYRLSEPPTSTDHRRTLYWNPELLTDEQGKANVIFYSNSRPEQRLSINAQGIGVNGQMFESK